MTIVRPWLNLWVVPALLLGAIVLPLLLYWGDLPNPMATHWDLGGDPNGTMPPLALLIVLGGIYLAMYFAVTRVVARTPDEGPSFIAGLFGVGALLAAVSWFSVLANRDETSWESASGFGLLQAFFVLGIALVAGVVGWLSAGGLSVERQPPSTAVPALEMAEPGAAIWSGRGNGRVLQLIGAAVIVLGIATWGWSTLVLLALGLLVLVFAEVRATVSQRGVVVSLGWLGVPSWTVPMSDITQAEVETVRPMAYGGWGYRLRPGVRAVITRGGGALRLVREGRADLVLTVDDAQTGAGLINSMLGVGTR